MLPLLFLEKMLVTRVKEIKMLRFKQHSLIELYKLLLLRLRKERRNRGFRAQQSIVASGPYSGCMTRHLQCKPCYNNNHIPPLYLLWCGGGTQEGLQFPKVTCSY